jgi:hypothetical protein
MLANLLPGIRDIRTPLATGYIWLLMAWLWIPEHLKTAAPPSSVPGDIARLASYSGRIGVGIALSFVAYLIGVLSELLNEPLLRIGSFISWYSFISSDIRRSRPFSRKRGEQPSATITLGRVVVSLLRRDFWRYSIGGITDDAGYWSRIALVNARYSTAGLYSLAETAERMTPQAKDRSARGRGTLSKDKEKVCLSYLVRHVYQLGNALLGREPELFASYDPTYS